VHKFKKIITTMPMELFDLWNVCEKEEMLACISPIDLLTGIT